MTTEQKIQYIADHYGIESQSIQLLEEMGELAQAVVKYLRSTGYGQGTDKSAYECAKCITEEMADVVIMLLQIKHLIGVGEDELSQIVESKLDRQIERIKKE